MSDEDILAAAKDFPAEALERALLAIYDGARIPSLREALKVELKNFLDQLFTEDAKEGLQAFLEKRAPKFSSVMRGAPEVEVKKESSVPEKKEAKLALLPPWESEECRMIREAVRDFAQGEIAPLVSKMEQEERIPRELIDKMADLGIFGVAFPEKYGGMGLGKIGACIVAEEITYVHPSTSVLIGAHVELACEALYLFGNEDQKKRYLEPAIKGKLLGALATTEPDVGSDVGSMKTSAKKVQGGWVLNGTKQFISNAENADFVIVFAQTDPLGGNKTLVSLIVETKSKGFSILKREKKIGIHASNTNSFALDEVFVPDANVLGEPGRGFKMVMEVFNSSRVTIGAACLGFISRAIDEAISFSKTRNLFGEPMWMKQNTQLKLAEMEATRFMVHSMVYQAAWLADRGMDIRTVAASVKYWAPELAGKVVDTSLQLHGGAGFIEDSPIAMFYRDARIFRLFEGTSEVQLLTIAKEVIKSRFF